MSHRDQRVKSTWRRVLVALFALWLTAQVIIAWAPFRLDVPRPVHNGADMLEDGTLEFAGTHARAATDPPASWNEAVRIEVDATVTTHHSDQRGPARILTIARDHTESNLVIGQDGSDLIIRVRHSTTTGVRRLDARIDEIFNSTGWQRVEVKIDHALRVAVNGREEEYDVLHGNALSAWNPTFGISLGDEVTGSRPWAGAVREATITIDGEEHDLLAPSVLEIPPRFWYVPLRLRDTSLVPDVDQIARSLLHFVVWVLGGAILAVRYSGGLNSWHVAAMGACLALLLQIGKLVISGRHPSLLDVATQTAGLTLGAMLASQFVLHRRQRNPPTADA